MNQYQLFRELRNVYPTITRMGAYYYGVDAVLIRTDEGISIVNTTNFGLKWVGPIYETVSLEEARIRHK